MAKISTIYPNTIWYRGSNSDHLQFRIDGNETDEFGPGLYFTDSYDIASNYGEVKAFLIDTSTGFYQKGDKIDKRAIKSIVDYADREHLEIAISNWDENPRIGKKKLLDSIFSTEDMPDAICRVARDVFRWDREDFWMSCKASGVYGLIYHDPYVSGRSTSFLVLFDLKKARETAIPYED